MQIQNNLRDNVLVRGVCNNRREELSQEQPAQAAATAVKDATKTEQTKVIFELRQSFI